MAEYAVPILPSRDLRETLRFYQRLGFDNRGAPPEVWDYLILGRGGLTLHFVASPGTDPAKTAGMCFAYVDDADAVYATWRGVVSAHDPDTSARLEVPIDTDYGMREFALVDTSGNLIRVGSPLSA